MTINDYRWLECNTTNFNNKSSHSVASEWYFLWVKAILWSIPNKLGGVIALFAALYKYMWHL